jgi:hypothetical protein
MLKKRNSVEIFFPEYDSDPREIYQIPEIRKWFSASITEGIPWFFFLHTGTRCTGLKLLLFCACDVELEEVRSDGHLLVTSPEDRSAWLQMNFHNLNVFTEHNDISVEINKEICEAVVSCLFENHERGIV